MNNITSTSSDIFLSRDKIRLFMIEMLKYYGDLQQVDLTKSSFLSYFIDNMSTFTSNILFYATSVYKEFFMTKAQLNESVLNLSAFLGYSSRSAKYSTCDVLITIPLQFESNNVSFTIPNDFKFYAGEIEFNTYYSVNISVIDNINSKVSLQTGNKIYDLPVYINSEGSEFSFLLPVRQYKIIEQEFQVDSDLQAFQFLEFDVAFEGQPSSVEVSVVSPNGFSVTYEKFNSLYLMNNTQYGYISKRTSNGLKLYFGNGLMGFQPEPGSKINVTIYTTLGSDGNIIAGSINKGNRIYLTNENNEVKLVDYSCINPSPALNGENEEDINEIRNNAINNLVSMSRLVSETDYINMNTILKNNIFGKNSLPILKRSDLKCNEIQLFTTINFNDEFIPMRNGKIELNDSTDYIPKLTEITINDEEFYTFFDLEIDRINSSANYSYIINEVSLVPILNYTYNSEYEGITIVDLNVKKTENSGRFELTYNGEDEYAECSLRILQNGKVAEMTNDPINKCFYYEFTPYTTFPKDNVNIYFTISNPEIGDISTFSTSLTFRKPLKSIMMSNVICDSTSTIIYDVPLIKKEYYNEIEDKKFFELSCFQNIINLELENFRMLTDFTNIKFTTTCGKLDNMRFNNVSSLPVIDIISSPPDLPVSGDRYIIDKNPTGEFSEHRNKICQYTGSNWIYMDVSTDDMIFVENKNYKYIFTGTEWVQPIYDIPVKLQLDVFTDQSYTGNKVDLINTIKDTLIETFYETFGNNTNLYRSRIIKTVQSIDGVSHCNLIHPKSNIFFDYDIDTFIQEELFEYSPQLVHFTRDSININIF